MEQEKKKKGMPLLGDSFPEMSVMTTQGEFNLPSHFKGQWFVLFSHPGDFTPVCTTEFISFQQRYNEFKELNCELIGLSVDQVFSHMKWTEWIKDNLDVEIEFPIIADTGEVAETLGLIHPGKGTNTVRAVFVVDEEAKIRIILYYPQELGRNMDEIVRIVKAMQLSDEEGIAIPADWPNNDKFGDRVLLPPAKSKKEAEDRRKMAEKGECEYQDWWFCYKNLNNR